LNYKETLFFIAKCLTISLEKKNRDEIELVLKTTDVDWDKVVKVSTSHYVFPALYCNFKRVDFLQYLPHELVSYMEHITDINRERNKQIILQANELNNVLLANNIRPIFLKGAGNLLAGIYGDIAERMVGDIDFLVSEKKFFSTIKILKNNSYGKEENQNEYSTRNRHYTRLVKKGNIAAVEIHKEITLEKYTNEFNYSFVNKDSQLINGIIVLSYANKLNLSIIANQINDYGFYHKSMALRNAYDIFLLSKKTVAKDAVNTLDKLKHPLNCFLAACFEIFNQADSLTYNPTAKTASYLGVFNSQFNDQETTNKRFKRIKIYLDIKLIIILKCIIHKEYRVSLFNLLTDKNWYKKKLVQFGIKK
jgi:hypothetical protein